MTSRNNFSIDHQEPQNKIETEFMSSPKIPPLTSYGSGLQTHESTPVIVDDEWPLYSFSVAGLFLSWLEHTQCKLEEIRQEAENAYASDNEIDAIPDSAYDDASFLLEVLFNYDIPMPHIGWAEDGSIGFEWRPHNGIATIGIYGDNHLIYGVFFQETRQTDGVCSLMDTVLLEGFLETLKRLL